MIHFFCPHCDCKLTAVSERAGTETVCSACHRTLLVPQPPSQAKSPSAPAATSAAGRPSQWSDAYTPSAVPAGHRSPPVHAGGQGMAVAALVLGIISLVMFWCLLLGVPLAILAIVFGSLGMNKPGHGMAVAGLVMGTIELGLTALMMIMGSMHVRFDF